VQHAYNTESYCKDNSPNFFLTFHGQSVINNLLTCWQNACTKSLSAIEMTRTLSTKKIPVSGFVYSCWWLKRSSLVEKPGFWVSPRQFFAAPNLRKRELESEACALTAENR
jgi:hypothetical protein